MTGYTSVAAGATAITARGPLRDAAERVLGRLWIDEVPVRLASEDTALWLSAATAEVEDRALCWPAQPGPGRAVLERAAELRARALEAGLTEVVLLGGGVPALAAQAIVRNAEALTGGEAKPGETGAPADEDDPAGRDPEPLRLTVLDGPEPGPVLRLADDPERLGRTLIVVTGDDPGTEALQQVFLRLLAEAGLSAAEVAERFVTVAEPGSAAARRAAEAGHALVEAPAPTVFGALSPYALVPAVLAGADGAALLDEATTALPALTRPENNPGLVLGAILGGAARAGRGTVVLGGYAAARPGLAAWIAALLGGATGGRLTPIVQDGGYTVLPGPDLFLVTLDGRPHQDDATVSGPPAAQFVVWEYAAAVAAYLLDADPLASAAPAPLALDDGAGDPLFTDGEPGRAIEAYGTDPAFTAASGLEPLLDALAGRVGPDEHLAVLVYLDPDREHGDGARVRRLAAVLAARCARPVTVGWGHRDPAIGHDLRERGVYLVVTGNVVRDVPVPGRHHRLGMLQLARALGDARAARALGRPVARLHLQDRRAGLERLLDAARGG
ncbi:hypothetical protein [Spirillospora albida]|uniref:hypothetical protein n=1 Tax=Spirillospora albida TaxID=58123 RepID=UPI00069001F4|nr:hypothetical protein [Spirillospora albida]